MYYVQVIGIIVESIKESSDKIVSRLQIIHNSQKFYIQLVFKLSDKRLVEKYIKKDNKVFLSGEIVKSIYKKNSIQYTNETLFVDKFELITCKDSIENLLEKEETEEELYNDF